MSRRCATCGQPLPVRPSTDAEGLLLVLRRPGGDGEPRSVYRGNKTDDWYITYGGGPFNGDLVRRLVEEGQLSRTYPQCADSYLLAENRKRTLRLP